MKLVRLLLIAATVVFGGILPAVAAPTVDPTALDKSGNIMVPDNYRSNYEYLGTWAVAATEGQGSKEMHTVYASKGATKAFQSMGHFPDGTVLVKEVFDTETGSMTTGTVSHPAKLKGWFVMVRGEKYAPKDSKLWANGWGWSWFDADKPKKTTSTDFKTDCMSCHVPAKDSDWIYSSGYQTLKK